MQVPRIYRHRFGPADHLGQHQHQCSDGVKMTDGVEGESACQFGGRVPQSVGDVSMRILVHRYGQQEAWSNQGKILESFGNIEVEHQPTLSTRPAANASTAGNEPENWNRGLKGGIQLQMCG